MTDTEIKKGTVLYVPSAESVQELAVERTSKGIPYVRFPGDPKMTRLGPGQFFINKVKALRHVERSLSDRIKNYRMSVAAARNAIRQDERSLNKFSGAKARVRDQIKSIRSTVNVGEIKTTS